MLLHIVYIALGFRTNTLVPPFLVFFGMSKTNFQNPFAFGGFKKVIEYREAPSYTSKEQHLQYC